MVEWPHQLHGHVFGQTPRDSEGQGSMLQSMGSQRVGHNLATEQKPLAGYVHHTQILTPSVMVLGVGTLGD